MANGIDEPLPPEEVNPTAFHALPGNWRDDDGEALDDYFVGESDALPFTGIASETHEYAREAAPAITRILARSLTIGLMGDGVSLADPVQVFPADRNRKELQIQCSGAICIASEKSDVYNTVLLAASSTPLVLSGHTGALWVYTPDGTKTVTVAVWSVTE